MSEHADESKGTDSYESEHVSSFVKALGSTILDYPVEISNYELDGLVSFSDIYTNMSIDERKTLLWVVRQTQIDTISEVLGIIDGSSTLNGCASEFDLFIDGLPTHDLMQDLFLEHIQETEPGY